MRILYYSPHPTLRLDSRSGYGTHMRAMIRAFEQLGHEVVPLIMGDRQAEKTGDAEPTSPRTKRALKSLMPGLLWNSLKDARLQRFDRAAARLLEETLQQAPPDLVYERAAYLQVSGVETCDRLGVPHVLEMNSPYVEERTTLGGRSLLSGRGNRAEERQLRLTDRVAVVSSVLAEHLARKHGIAREKFVITPNAVFPEDHEGTPPGARRPPGVPAGAQVVGFVGSIFRWHGLDLLVTAVAALTEAHPRCHAVIVGDGEPLPELREQADRLGLADRVHFTGSVPHADVFGFLRGMDVAVLPRSHWYGSPVKLFEYGAMGLPIVAIRNGPVSEVLTDGEHGLLVEDDAEALADAIGRLLDDGAGARGLGAAFRAKVLRSHTWEHNACAVLEGMRRPGQPGPCSA